jgi:steroid delta-isomerase-like uncharacterized protein
MSQAIEDVMRRFVAEVMNQGNFDVVDEIVHPSYVYRSPDEELHGREALKVFLSGYHAAFPDLKMAIDELVVADDKAVIFFTLTGTHEGPLMGIPPTGKEMRVHGVVRSRFEDGRIVEEWEVLDQLAILTQLGVVSLPS